MSLRKMALKNFLVALKENWKYFFINLKVKAPLLQNMSLSAVEISLPTRVINGFAPSLGSNAIKQH